MSRNLLTQVFAIAAAITAAALVQPANAQTAPAATGAAQTPIQNCRSEGMIHITRVCDFLDPVSFSVIYTQTCRAERTIWSDRPQLKECVISRPTTLPAPDAAQSTAAAATTPARPCN